MRGLRSAGNAVLLLRARLSFWKRPQYGRHDTTIAVCIVWAAGTYWKLVQASAFVLDMLSCHEAYFVFTYSMGLPARESWAEQQLKLPSQSSCRSLCRMRGWHCWRSVGMCTGRQHRVRSRRWWWLAVSLYHVPWCSSSLDWSSVRSPHTPERNDSSVIGVPAGWGSQLLRHQKTARLSWSRYFVLSLRRAKLKSLSSDRVRR